MKINTYFLAHQFMLLEHQKTQKTMLPKFKDHKITYLLIAAVVLGVGYYLYTNYQTKSNEN